MSGALVAPGARCPYGPGVRRAPWPSKGALALDCSFHAVEDRLAFPDTRGIRADLLAQ